MTAASPDDRKLLRLEVRDAETPIERKPEWIRTRARIGPDYTVMMRRATMSDSVIADSGRVANAISAASTHHR